MRTEYVEAVLALARLIPPGRVLAYGDLAELLGVGGPRQIGAVMSRYGSSVPWWRVLRASGQPPRCHEGRAREHYLAEDTPLHPGGDDAADCRVRMAAARWRPDDAAWDRIARLARQVAGTADVGSAPAVRGDEGNVSAP